MTRSVESRERNGEVVSDGEGQSQTIEQVVNTLRAIIGALMMGLIVFLVIVLAVMRPEREDELLFTYVALGAGVVALIASPAVQRSIINEGRRQVAKEIEQPGRPEGASDETTALLGIFQTKRIAGAALIEGAAFFALICYMLEGHPLAIAAAVFLMATLATFFPTRDGVSRWLETQRAEVEQLRQLPG